MSDKLQFNILGYSGKDYDYWDSLTDEELTTILNDKHNDECNCDDCCKTRGSFNFG